MANNDDRSSDDTCTLLTREKFLAKFKSDTNKKQTKTQVLIGQRWSYLYELKKLKQEKLIERIKNKEVKNNYLFTRQCTFTPKTNKLPKYLFKNDDKTFSSTQKSTESMVNRQETWSHNLKIKIETLRQTNNNQLISDCNFYPVINQTDSVNNFKISKKTEDVIVNYNSYKSYIERVRNKRKELLSQNQMNAFATGKRWKRGMLTINNNYDYSKHEYIDNKLNQSKVNHKMCLYKNSMNEYNSGNSKNQSSQTPILSSKKKNKTFENNLLFTEQTSFRNALNKLHNELLSINLMKDE